MPVTMEDCKASDLDRTTVRIAGARQPAEVTRRSRAAGRHAASADVHCGHRVALIEMVDAQNGQSFVVGAAAGAG